MAETRELAWEALPELCPNCGEDVHGQYCSRCGGKHRTSDDYLLRNVFVRFFQEFTQLDSRLFRSFFTLLFRPGKLSTEWCEGRERSYVSPFQLFLIVNIAYFLFQQAFNVDTIVVSLTSQYSWQIYSHRIRPIVDDELKARHLSFQKFEEQYDSISADQSKTLIFLMIPILAGIAQILYWRRHRYFVEHLVFSLHFYTFFLLVLSFGSFLINEGIILWMRLWNMHGYTLDWDEWLTLSNAAIILLYLGIAVRRFYGGSRLLGWVRAGVLTYSLLYILWLYRFVLFFTTMALLKLKL